MIEIDAIIKSLQKICEGTIELSEDMTLSEIKNLLSEHFNMDVAYATWVCTDNKAVIEFVAITEEYKFVVVDLTDDDLSLIHDMGLPMKLFVSNKGDYDTFLENNGDNHDE